MTDIKKSKDFSFEESPLVCQVEDCSKNLNVYAWEFSTPKYMKVPEC